VEGDLGGHMLLGAAGKGKKKISKIKKTEGEEKRGDQKSREGKGRKKSGTAQAEKIKTILRMGSIGK